MVGFVDDDDEGPRPVGVGQAHVETETVDSADVPLPAAALMTIVVGPWKLELDVKLLDARKR